jgi:hypothetical protein
MLYYICQTNSLCQIQRGTAKYGSWKTARDHKLRFAVGLFWGLCFVNNCLSFFFDHKFVCPFICSFWLSLIIAIFNLFFSNDLTSFDHRVLDFCDKVWQWLATGQWFSPSTPVSSTNKNCPLRNKWNIAYVIQNKHVKT